MWSEYSLSSIGVYLACCPNNDLFYGVSLNMEEETPEYSKLCGRPPSEGWKDSEGCVYLEMDSRAFFSDKGSGQTSIASEFLSFSDDSYFRVTYPDSCTPYSSYFTG
jgi:hypothetical protein